MTDLVSIGFKADTSDLSKAGREFDNLSRKGQTAERTTKQSTTAMVRDYSRIKVAALGAAAGIAAVAAAGALVSKARRDISQFGQSIADLSAITGAAGRDLAFYSEQAQEIGRTTSLSASQAVEAFKLIGSAKPDLLGSADALNQVTREAVTLAEAAGIDLPNAASALGSALNQFQLDATKSNEVINILAASAKFGAAEIPAVTEALRNAGPAANALSVDLAETVAGIQGLAIAGRQGADAGTGLRQVLLRLEKTADAQLQPSVVGLTGALLELERRNLSNTELMELFGDEAFTAGTALLTQAGNVEKLNSQLRGTETATEQASIRMDTLKGDGLELDSAIEGLSITFGEKLEPALRSSTQWLTEFINKITEAVGGQTIASLEEEIASLEERLSSSRFFGRSAGAQESALQQQLATARAELALLKADAGDLDAVADALVSSRAELESLLDGNSGRGQMSRGNAARIAELRAQISEYESVLRGTVLVTENIAQAETQAAESTENHGKAAQKLSEKYKELLTDLETQTKMLTMSEREQFIYNEQIKLGVSDNHQYAQSIREVAASLYDQTEALKTNGITLKTAADDQFMSSLIADMEAVEKLEGSLNPLIAQTNEWIKQEKIINDLLKKGLISKQDAERLNEQLADSLDDVGRKTKDTATEFETAWKRGIERVDDMFANLWTSAFDGFKDFGSTLKRSFTGLLAELAHAAITRPIVMQFQQAFSGGGGGTGQSGAAAGGTGGVAGAGNTIVGAIQQGLMKGNNAVVEGIAKLGVSIGGNFEGIRGTLGNFLIENNVAISKALPYAGAILQAVQGDVKGAAFTAAGTYLGSLFGPIGAAIGGALGSVVGSLFGGDDLPDRVGGIASASSNNGVISSRNMTGWGEYDPSITGGIRNATTAFVTSLDALQKGFDIEKNIYATARYSGRDGGSSYWGFSGGGVNTGTMRDKDAFGQENLEAFLGRIVGTYLVQAIQKSDIPSQVKRLFNGMTDNASINKMIQASINLNNAQEQLAERFGLTVNQAAQVALASGAAGDQLRELVNYIAQTADGSKSLGQQLVQIREAMESVYGGALPASLTAYDEALKAIDTTTQAGIDSFYELFALREGFADYTAGINELKSAVSGAVFGLLNPTEQLKQMRANTSALFEEFGLEVPSSVQGLIQIASGIDFMTEEGLNLASVFPSLVDAFMQTREQADALADSLSSLDSSRFSNVVDFRRAVALNQNGIPGFANGGYHSGGLRMVGENGPEIEATGPSRIFNQDQLIDMRPMAQEIAALRSEVAALRYGNNEIARNTKTTADVLERVTRDGNSLITESAA